MTSNCVSFKSGDLLATEMSGGVLSPIIGAKASAIERCEAEIATALSAIMDGSLPLEEAMLYYTDWWHERELLLAEAAGTPATAAFAKFWRRNLSASAQEAV